MEEREEQSLNAKSPIEVTLLGIVIEVSEEQFENSPSPIDVTPSGIVIEVIEELSSASDLPSSMICIHTVFVISSPFKTTQTGKSILPVLSVSGIV